MSRGAAASPEMPRAKPVAGWCSVRLSRLRFLAALDDLHQVASLSGCKERLGVKQGVVEIEDRGADHVRRRWQAAAGTGRSGHRPRVTEILCPRTDMVTTPHP